MASIASILVELKSFHRATIRRGLENNRQSSDKRIYNLYKKIQGTTCTFGEISLGSKRFRNVDLSAKMTLADLQVARQCSEKAFLQILEFLGITKKQLEGGGFRVLERMEATDLKILDRVSLYSLQLFNVAFEGLQSPVFYALLPEEEFLNIQVSKIKDSELIAPIFVSRFREIGKNVSGKSISYPDFRGITVGNLYMLDAKQVRKNARRLGCLALKVLRDDQKRQLNYKALSQEQISSLMQVEGAWDEMKSQNLQYLVERLDASQLSHIQGLQLRQLNYSRLTEEKIRALIGLSSKATFVPMRFVNRLVQVLGAPIVKELTDEQCRAIDPTQFNKQTVQQFFFPGFTKDSFLPGAKCKFERKAYVFELIEDYSGDWRHLSADELSERFKENQAQCMNSLKRFNREQLAVMLPIVHSDVRKWAMTELRKNSTLIHKDGWRRRKSCTIL